MAVIKIDSNRCTGCKVCYNECPLDVFGWDKQENRPTILYSEECWYCGACEIDCPVKAIDVSQSIAQW